jgi:hypothetical protein
VGPTSCAGQTAKATACFLVEIRNEGTTTGSGSCRLRVTTRVNGDEVSVLGERVDVTSVPVGASVKTVAVWTAEPAKDGLYSYLCDPPIRM